MRRLLILCCLLVAAWACSGTPEEVVAGDDVAATTTTAVEVVEDTAPSTTSPPVSSDAPTMTVADVLVESSTTTAAPVGEVFASPSGSTLQEITSVAEVHEFLTSLIGPTEDVGGMAARFAPFPNVPTFADAEVTWVTVDIENDFHNDRVTPDGLTISINIEGTTPATQADVDVAFQSSMAVAGFEQINEGENRFELGNEARFSMFTRAEDDGTFFKYDYLWFSDEPDPDFVVASSQWAGKGPWGDGLLTEVEVGAFWSTETFEIRNIHEFLGQDEDTVKISEATRLVDSPWVAYDDIIGTTLVRIEGVPGNAQIRLTESSDDGVPFTVQRFVYEDDF